MWEYEKPARYIYTCIYIYRREYDDDFRMIFKHPSNILGRFSDFCQMLLRSFWDHSGIILGSIGGHLEVILESFGLHSGIILESFGGHLDFILAPFWIHLEVIWGPFWDYFLEFSPRALTLIIQSPWGRNLCWSWIFQPRELILKGFVVDLFLAHPIFPLIPGWGHAGIICRLDEPWRKTRSQLYFGHLF